MSKVVIQVVIDDYPQIDPYIVENTPEAKEQLLKEWSSQSCYIVKLLEIGWFQEFNNRINFHMPVEWVPGNNPPIEAFSSNKFFSQVFNCK